MRHKILLLTSSSPRTRSKSAFKATGKLAHELSVGKQFSVEYERIQQVVFNITRDEIVAYLPEGKKLEEYDAIYVKRWLEEPWFGSVLRTYFSTVSATDKLLNTEFVDIPNVNKFIEAIRFRENGIPSCESVFSININHVATEAQRIFGFPFVFKSAEGSRGQDNYLVTDASQLETILERHQNELFIAQNFVPNTCDYRVLVVDGEPKLVIKRSRTDAQSHLNNVSLGADADTIEIAEFDQSALQLAIKASQCFDLNICGVDLLQNSKTNEWVVLEVNATPDVTGSFADKKTAIVSDYFQSRL